MKTDGNIVRSTVNVFGLIKGILIAVVVVILIIVLLGVPLPVNGSSMNPNFYNGDVVLIKRLSFVGDLQRGDVVAAAFPADPTHTKLIKRVIGLPGDTITFDDYGHVSVNGKTLNEDTYKPIYGQLPAATVNNVTLGSGEYFLMGDNRPGSSDSRIWCPVQSGDIQGRVEYIIWPFNKAAFIGTPIYN